MQISKKLVKIQTVINQLENAGYCVHLSHINNGKAKEGQYTVFSIDHQGDMLSVCGIARCAPGDAYNKVKGTQIAFGRAMRALSDRVGSNHLRQILH